MDKKEYVIIKGKINTNLDNASKSILKELKMTKQEFIEKVFLSSLLKKSF